MVENEFKNDTDFLDQHFLIDDKVINKVIEVSDIKRTDVVLEIGPGKGVLTKKIIKLTNNLTLIEKDKRLNIYLDKIENIKVIYDDVLNVDISGFNIIITSLPYSITEPFIYKLIDYKFDKLVMICGKNYADNVVDNSNNKLSILTNLYFNVKKIIDIEPNSFEPKPRVMSSLIVLTTKDDNTLNKKERIIKMLFKYRYMKTKNALKEILIKLNNITQREARNIIELYKIDKEILDKLFDELNSDEVVKLINSIR